MKDKKGRQRRQPPGTPAERTAARCAATREASTRVGPDCKVDELVVSAYVAYARINNDMYGSSKFRAQYLTKAESVWSGLRR